MPKPKAKPSELRETDVVADRRPEGPLRGIHEKEVRRIITKGLSKNERLILILYYYEQKTMKEISTRLDISESRVRQMYSAILERLREGAQGNRRKVFPQGPPVCKRGKRARFNPAILEELQSRKLHWSRPVKTLQDVQKTAHRLIEIWRPMVELVEEVFTQIDRCLKVKCTYATMLYEGPPMDGQKCPLCLRALCGAHVIFSAEILSANLARTAARLLPDAYSGLEIAHLFDLCDDTRFFLEKSVDAAERDWNRLLKAAVLARARQEVQATESPPEVTVKPHVPATPGRPGEDAAHDHWVKIGQFLEQRYPGLSPNRYESMRLALQKANREKVIEFPPTREAPRRGAGNFFGADALREAWPGFCGKLLWLASEEKRHNATSQIMSTSSPSSRP
jgi:hypothetical protein